MSGALWVASLACVLMGSGLGWWAHFFQRQQAMAVESYVQQVLDRLPAPATAQTAAVVPVMEELPPQAWGPLWLQSSITRQQQGYWLWGSLAVALMLWWWIGGVAAVVLWVLVIAIRCFAAWLQWQKKRRKAAEQLPAFIDGMVRMVVLGHSVQAAFVMSSATAKAPLDTLMQQAAGFVKAGRPIEVAIVTAGRHLQVTELQLLASIIQVGARYGGRVDVLLERVAQYLRDREQAEHELKALTAEVRLSAWILSLLPLVVAGMIIVSNAGYFMQMWSDPTGRKLMLGAAVLQGLGVITLYRLSKLEG